jgi:hypothetical protein
VTDAHVGFLALQSKHICVAVSSGNSNGEIKKKVTRAKTKDSKTARSGGRSEGPTSRIKSPNESNGIKRNRDRIPRSPCCRIWHGACGRRRSCRRGSPSPSRPNGGASYPGWNWMALLLSPGPRSIDRSTDEVGDGSTRGWRRGGGNGGGGRVIAALCVRAWQPAYKRASRWKLVENGRSGLPSLSALWAVCFSGGPNYPEYGGVIFFIFTILEKKSQIP